MVAETSPQCGHSGRVCRVFWRAGVPWILLRTPGGLLLPLPWTETDLPVPPASAMDAAVDAPPHLLLAPSALVALVGFLHHQGGGSSD